MNSLFIGLGGAGCSAVAEYAKMLRNAGIDSNDSFMYFDTDRSIVDNYPIIGNDFVHLGHVARGARHTINQLVRNARDTVTNPNLDDLRKKESKQLKR